MTTKKPHVSAGTESPALSEESTASTAAKTAEKPPTGSVAGYVASASSKATKQAYASDVRHFIQQGGAIPATPAMVAEYLAKLAPAMKVATLERRCVSIAQAHRAATCKMSTPVLTRLLLEAVQFQSPKRAGMFRPKMRYAHQGGMNPPVIVIHGNSLEHVTDAYKRFLEGRFRKEFDLVGTPLRIEMKTSHNPFADKDEG